MGKKGLVLLVCGLFPLITIAQTIRITDQKDEPISQVFIYHDKRSYTALTDKNGVADISHFPKDGYFHFQHQALL